LCVFACGRSAIPQAFARAAIVAMLRSRASRSTIRAGVSIEVRDVFMEIPHFDALAVLGHSGCFPTPAS
jgi:hypothetical protein